jgi:putative transposase
MLGELVRAALESELTAHLGYEKGGRGDAGGNARIGNIAKTVQTGVGPVPLPVPRDRAGTFEPVLVPKRSEGVRPGCCHGAHGARTMKELSLAKALVPSGTLM